MEKVFLTGASGRIGVRLGQLLLNDGFEVIGLDLAPARLAHEQYSHVQTNYKDGVDLNDCLQGVAYVLHLGAMMSWHPQDNPQMFEANVSATQSLLSAAKDVGVGRFVFASSGEVYPETAAKVFPITEDMPMNPTSFYGLTKKLGEELVSFYQRQGLETVILRFPHTQSADEVLDPDSFFSGPRFFLESKIKQMEFFGNTVVAEKLEALRGDDGPKMIIQHGEEDGLPYQMHIADVRDVAHGVYLAMTHPKAANEIFNLEPDDVVEFDKALPRMAEITGLPLVKAYMPGKAVHYRTSNAKIKELLGFQPEHTFMGMVEENVKKLKDEG
ncbi:NAD-dependent epimerase/dehydratase family protein [Opitutia bacterium ISCC 51]|nr:NAD-dependent epimerase/dehydratase family protein [Opitutae bacterium ISCC 51]QXD27353.1 NAD-dependent epimerase/dehydratase family protein [Opitutae bacterium ISCC 52]